METKPKLKGERILDLNSPGSESATPNNAIMSSSCEQPLANMLNITIPSGHESSVAVHRSVCFDFFQPFFYCPDMSTFTTDSAETAIEWNLI